MKKTLTKAPVIPEGWMPKPAPNHYSFWNWFSGFNTWMQTFHVSSQYQGKVNAYYHD